MIWFVCSQCGKKHSRPESSIGTLVFCECGQGNTVPWESTVEPPPLAPEPAEAEPLPVAMPAPMPPRLEPIPIGEEHLPARRPAPRRRGEGRVRNPSFCFNHVDLPSEQTCVECEERFCSNCVVNFEGNMYCGPCKNLVVRRQSRPPQMSWLALSSLVGGLMVGPAGFCVLALQMGPAYLPFILIIVLLQAGALGTGLLALYKLEHDPYLMGKSLAMTGIVSAGLGILVTAVASFYSTVHWV